MSKLKVLLTGDDGYNSAGIRILVASLKDDFCLKIASSEKQRSAIGGGVTGSGTWGIDRVDGIEAVWTNGTPGDAVECAEAAFGKDFDLVVSGINFGPNVGCCNSSGTVGAALRCLSRGSAPKGLAISWLLPKHTWFLDNHNQDISKLLDYPGSIAKKIIIKALEEKFWNSDFLNVNLPNTKSNRAIFVKPIEKSMKDYFHFDVVLNKQTKTFTCKIYNSHSLKKEVTTDAHALECGYVTITPWLNNLYLNKKLLSLIGKKFKL